MGLKKITVMFLGIGAIFAFTGGLGVCAYNCRWYDKNSVWGKGWGSQYKRPLDCALSSGIFGIFRAVLALVALILLLVDVNKIVVAVLFIIDLVLYLGELIPEALIIDDVKYGMGVPPECDTSSDLYKWITGGQVEAQRQKNTGLTGEDWQKVTRWGSLVKYIPGYDTQSCFVWETRVGQPYPEFVDKSGVASCVIDFKASSIPDSTVLEFVQNCDDYNIVADCHGGWSEGDLTSQVKSACKRYWNDMEDQSHALIPDGKTAEEFKKGYVDYFKKTTKTLVNHAIADDGSAEATVDGLPFVQTYLSSFSLANQILLGCQTIAFVATLVGVILLLVRKVGKVSSSP